MVQRDIGTQRKSEMLRRPKSKPKKKASKVDEKITTSLIEAMKSHVPDIGLGMGGKHSGGAEYYFVAEVK